MPTNWMPQLSADGTRPDEAHIIGAILLMEIVERGHSAPLPIGELYRSVSEAVAQDRACLALGTDGEPVGYAILQDCGDQIVIARQFAPFGDHAALGAVVAQRLASDHHTRDRDTSRPLRQAVS